MKTVNILRSWLLIGFIVAVGDVVQAQTTVPSTFANINIDGNFSDWANVPLAYTAPVGSSDAIQYENIYIANDTSDFFIRFTLYSARPGAFANSYDNIFIDSDDNASTGYPFDGIGSEMLIQSGTGYQEGIANFTEGNINGLGWSIAGSSDSMDFELEISRSATYASDGELVFTNNTIAVQLEGDDTGYNNVEFAPSSGGFAYTFATSPVPEPSTTGLALAGFGFLIMTGKLIRKREGF